MPTEWTHAADSRPWQSGRLHYDASISGVCRPQFTKSGIRVEQTSMLNQFILELQYSAAFGRESKGNRKYAKCRHFLAHRVVYGGPGMNPTRLLGSQIAPKIYHV